MPSRPGNFTHVILTSKDKYRFTTVSTVEDAVEEFKSIGRDYTKILKVIPMEEFKKQQDAKLSGKMYTKFLVRVCVARTHFKDIVFQESVLARTKQEAIDVLRSKYPEYGDEYSYKVLSYKDLLKERQSNEPEKDKG